MGDAVAALLALLGDPNLLGLMALAVPIGLVFGIVPGLGGKLGIVLLIPFVVDMDAVSGAVFLVAMHAVVHTGGSVPSILLGIPGTGPDAATVVDGYPMTRNGEAGRALGAGLSASALGGVIGAMFLALLLPILEPLVLALGPAEMFLLAVLGITFIAGVSGDSLLKGLAVGCLGLMLAMVGLNPHTGEPRFTLGLLALWDGVDLVTAVLAMYAVPEMIALGAKGGAMTRGRPEPAAYRLKQVVAGMGDVVRHWWLALRTAVIGAFIGMMPGVGGEAAAWICYGHTVQSSRTPERFGKGAVEGVIGPEAANNSKEGGSLFPTLFFGVPGSGGMALMLGAFVILGIQPGPDVFLNQLDLVWILIWTLVFANLMAVAVFLGAAQHLSLVAHLPGGILIPSVLGLAVLGSVLSTGDPIHLILLMLLGTLGYGLKRHGWPRAPFAIGIALGPIAENSLHKAVAIWGPGFLLRPGALVLLAVIALGIGIGWWRRGGWRRIRGGGAAGSTSAGEFVVLGAMGLTFAAMLLEAISLAPAARLAPLVVGMPALAVVLGQLASDLRRRGRVQGGADDPPGGRAAWGWLGWLFCLIGSSISLGAGLALPIFVFMGVWWTRTLPMALLVAGSVAALVVGIDQLGMSSALR